jgi:natural resistance-associated macrophage protein
VGFFSEQCAPDNKAWIVTDAFPDGVCGEISLMNAGEVLETLLGDAAGVVWAVGLLAAGQAATMTGTFAGQYVMEGFLQLQMKPWQRVLITRCTALVPAFIIAVLTQKYAGLSDVADQWLNVVQTLALPFALFALLAVGSDKRLFGDMAPSNLMLGSLWVITVGVIVCNGVLMQDTLIDIDADIFENKWSVALVVFISVSYLAILARIAYDPLRTCLKRGDAEAEERLVTNGLDMGADSGSYVNDNKIPY